MSKATANWLVALPIALLGIRSTLKEDLHCTSAELVYGTTLRLPSDFFHASTPTDMVEDPLSYVDRLKSTMRRLQAIPTDTTPAGNLLNMCSSSVTQSSAPYNHVMMALFQSSSTPPSTTPSRSTVNYRPYFLVHFL